MKVHVDYWHWAGSLIGLSIMTLALSAPLAHGQVQGEFGPASESAAPDMAGPSAPPTRQVSGPPRSVAPAPAPSRRRVDPEGDTPISNFDSLAAGPTKAKALEEPPHPLAAAHPAHHVVVCLAGCRQGTPAIVFIAPRSEHSPTPPPPVTRSSAFETEPGGPSVTHSATIECLAGCYAGTKSYTVPVSMPAAKSRETAVRRSIPTADWTRITRGAGPLSKHRHRR